MPLFDVAVIKKPTKKEAEDGALEELVLAPKSVIARDAQAAAIKVLMGEKITVDLDKCEVLIRPFA